VSGAEVLDILKHQYQVEVKDSRGVSKSVSMNKKIILFLLQIEPHILSCSALIIELPLQHIYQHVTVLAFRVLLKRPCSKKVIDWFHKARESLWLAELFINGNRVPQGLIMVPLLFIIYIMIYHLEDTMKQKL
jgi:hypothetical protein